MALIQKTRGVLRPNLLPWVQYSKRGFYWILYSAANKIDEGRIKVVGADRACAEWLVKCGASVRFHGRKNSISDYNKIGASVGPEAKLAEVYAEEATIMGIGFPHFKNVNELVKVTFKKCGLFDDTCVSQLAKHCSHSVKDLHIATCDVTADGLHHLSNFSCLQKLSLIKLPAIKDAKVLYHDLCTSLPDCKISIVTDTATLQNYSDDDAK